MLTSFWVTLAPGADRPYCSSAPPTPERAEALRRQGCQIMRVEVEFPDWNVEDGRLHPLKTERTL